MSDPSKYLIKSDKKDICSICLEKADHRLTCNHFFHPNCIEPWRKETNSCPTCRKPIEPEKPIKKLKSDTDDDQELALRLRHREQILPLFEELNQLFRIIVAHEEKGEEEKNNRRVRTYVALSNNNEPIIVSRGYNIARISEGRSYPLVICAYCGTGLRMGRDELYNCRDCGEMFYCSLHCEENHKDVHICQNSPENNNQ